MIHDGTVNAEVFASFLDCMVAGMDRQIILALDQHRIHRAKIVTEKVLALNGRLEIVFLPPYSPQLNPRRRRVGAREAGSRKADRPDELIQKATAALDKLKAMPEAVRAIFGHPDFQYAAE